MIFDSYVYYEMYFIKITANFKIKFECKKPRLSNREMILKVVQKILIKTRHEACRRLKFSSACSCEQSEAKISFKTSVATPQVGFL